MWDFRDAWWQQTYQVKSIVLNNVRMLRPTMEINLVSLLPPSVAKSYKGIDLKIFTVDLSSTLFFTCLQNFFIFTDTRDDDLLLIDAACHWQFELHA